MKKLCLICLLAAFTLLFSTCDELKYGTVRITNSYSSPIIKVICDKTGNMAEVTGLNELNKDEKINPGSSRDIVDLEVSTRWVGMEAANGKTQITKVEIEADKVVTVFFSPN
ncbi:MAG: hypothetical protein FWH38_01980 [Treponema sp.]|nr:hypothetical protein [Treponema sp.]